MRVVQSANSMLNRWQWAASIAGEWYCETCPSNARGKTWCCYWWTHELEDVPERVATAWGPVEIGSVSNADVSPNNKGSEAS